ncbi:MAG: hypothetical protein KIG95_11485, partial [Comamonas sp.]|nr:hypothetical protein [Comamonas sp.]
MTTNALITQLTGEAWVRSKDGKLIPIRQGIALPVGLRLVTAPHSSIQLQAEGMSPLVLPENTDITLTEDLFTPVDFGEAGTDTNLSALLQALEQEADTPSTQASTQAEPVELSMDDAIPEPEPEPGP